MRREILILLALASNGAQAESAFEVFSAGYLYKEPGLMSLSGGKAGVAIDAETAVSHGAALGVYLRGASGETSYSSTGTGSSYGNGDFYVESIASIRMLSETGLTMRAGLGYRYLMSDIRGTTSTGHAGYRRESNYVFSALGLSVKEPFKLTKSKIDLEYDRLVRGWQISRLSDVDQTIQDLQNKQRSGFGLRAKLTLTIWGAQIGPYINYWNIDRSDIAPLVQSGVVVGYGIEPANETTEIGFFLSQPFN